MAPFNREERQTLRSIQAHLRASNLENGVIVEQLGTVDIYFHQSNPSPYLNCATPHRGVAWIRREDLIDAFAGLERLGRIPRLVFQDALFPAAFMQQLSMMDLTLEDERAVSIYRPLLGPCLPDEIMHGRVPDVFEAKISTVLATNRAQLATWVRVFRAGYYNTDTLTVRPEEVEPLVEAVERIDNFFILGYYENLPLGAARLDLHPPTAQIEAVVTAPLWHGMGLENALIATAVQAAADRGFKTVFTVAPPEDVARLYRRLGFTDITRVLTYWRLEDESRHTQPGGSIS